jgi:uncharacterized membrane protein YgcG
MPYKATEIIRGAGMVALVTGSAVALVWLSPLPLAACVALAGAVGLLAEVTFRHRPVLGHYRRVRTWWSRWVNLTRRVKVYGAYTEMRELALFIGGGSFLLVAVFATHLFEARVESYAKGIAEVNWQSCRQLSIEEAPSPAETRGQEPPCGFAPDGSFGMSEFWSEAWAVAQGINGTFAPTYCFKAYSTGPDQEVRQNDDLCLSQAGSHLFGRIMDVVLIIALSAVVFFLTWLNFLKSLGADMVRGRSQDGDAHDLSRRQWTTTRGLHEPVGDIFTMQGIGFTFIGLAFGLGKLPNAIGSTDGVDVALAEGSAVYTSSLALGLVASLLGVILATGAKWLHARYAPCDPDGPTGEAPGHPKMYGDDEVDPRGRHGGGGSGPGPGPGLDHGGADAGGGGDSGGGNASDGSGPRPPDPFLQELRELTRTIAGLLAGQRAEIVRLLDERVPVKRPRAPRKPRIDAPATAPPAAGSTDGKPRTGRSRDGPATSRSKQAPRKSGSTGRRPAAKKTSTDGDA